jgi:RHS repeat-associated protein
MYTGNSSQETTNYVGKLLEVVASGSVTDYRHYINVAGEQIAVYSRKSSGTNTFSYLLSDHQASVASITNSSGAQVVGESFDAFGSRRNPSTWSGAPSNSDLTTIAGVTREGYTFQTALGLWMGMNHMNGRVEDSITGRFLSADPHIPNRRDAQSYNRYTYVNNNPLSLIDPTGFDGCPPDSVSCVEMVSFTYNPSPETGYITITTKDGYIFDPTTYQPYSSNPVNWIVPGAGGPTRVIVDPSDPSADNVMIRWPPASLPQPPTGTLPEGVSPVPFDPNSVLSPPSQQPPSPPPTEQPQPPPTEIPPPVGSAPPGPSDPGGGGEVGGDGRDRSKDPSE